jgi:hypothetical protein
MMSQIDFRTLPANVPVLCIPRVYPNISESRIRKVFEKLNMGTLDHIDVVGKQSGNGEKFNRVYVHFRRWNDSENACVARERLLNGKEIKIIYDDPWFWKISAYREIERKSHAPKPTLHYEDRSQQPPRHPNSFHRDETNSRRPERRDERRIERRLERRDDSREHRRPEEELIQENAEDLKEETIQENAEDLKEETIQDLMTTQIVF